MKRPKRLLVNTELVEAVKKLIERGFRVVSTNCDTYTDFSEPHLGKVTQIQIEFGDYYPEAMFYGLPDDWILYNYHTAGDGLISTYTYSGISCSKNFFKTDDDIVEYSKEGMISKLERWLESIDPDGFKAVCMLAGYA